MYRVAFVAAACLAIIPEARAQTVLTLADTIARAREQAGAVAVARARIAEAEAGLLDASARFRENPIIETNIGPRSADSGSSTELDIGVSQLFETGGQRRARIAGAQASIERQRSEVGVTA